MTVGLYLRVSTQDQADEGYSIGEQQERLQNYCKAMRWNIHKIYIDPGYTGSNMDRPGLQAVIRDVEDGKIKKVVVYKLDRLSRSQLDTLYLIEKVFLANGADFVSMTENFDTSTPFGRAMIGILAVFAQLEREKIKERMAMGKEARAKEGRWHGGATQPIGYGYNTQTDELVVNDYEIMQVRELYELFLGGMPLRTIEKLFLEKGYTHKHGVWHPWTMRRVLRSKLYVGYIKHRNEHYPGLHVATIDEEQHKKAVALLDNRLEQFKAMGLKPGKQSTYLGGLLRCTHCGGKYTKTLNSRYREGKPKVYWYSCYSRAKKSQKMIKDPNCKNKNWHMIELDELVFNEIRKLATHPEEIHKAIDAKNKRLATDDKIAIIKKQIDSIDDQISRFMDLYGIGKFTIDQVSAKVDPLNDQKIALERELYDLTNTAELTVEETLTIVESFGDILDRNDFNEIRLTVETLIDHIDLDNDDVTIHWKFL